MNRLEAKSVICPECGGHGIMNVLRETQGECNLCHGWGRITQSKYDLWASQNLDQWMRKHGMKPERGDR